MKISMDYKLTLYPILIIVLLLSQQISESQAQLEQPNVIYTLDWNSDGTRVAITADDGIWIYDQNFRLLQFRKQPDPNKWVYPLWSPDNLKLAAGNQIWNSENMEPLLTVNTPVSLSQWSKDGKLIAGVSTDYHGISIYDANTGNLVKTVSSEEIMIEGAAWSPDNKNFAITAGAKTIGIIDLVQRRITARFPQEVQISGLIWSPDNSYLAYAGFAEVTVGTSGSLTSSGSTTGAVLHSVYIVDSSNGQIAQRFNGLPDYTIRLLWNSNGSELIAASRSGDIFVWNAITGEEIETFVTSNRLTAWDYSPFGGTLSLALDVNQPLDPITRQGIKTLSKTFQTFLDGAVQIVVPVPSLEKLKTIVEACNAQPTVEHSLITQINEKQLSTFKTQVDGLTNAQIPPGCKADLLAVANALIAQPQ